MLENKIILVHHCDDTLSDKVESFRKKITKNKSVLVKTHQGFIEGEVISGAPMITNDIFNHLNYAATIFLNVLTLVGNTGGVAALGYQLNSFITKSKKETDKDIVIIHEVMRINNFPLRVCFAFNKDIDDPKQFIAISKLSETINKIEDNLGRYNDFDIIFLNFNDLNDEWDLDNIKVYRQNTGSTSWTNCRVVKANGMAPKKAFPDKPNETLYELMNTKIPDEVKEIALRFKTSYYQRLYSVEDIKNSLVKTFGATICINIYDSFLNAPNGVIQLPSNTERKIGNHCVYIAGYNRTHFKFVNSWGEQWGDKGRGYLPFSYLETNLIEAWSSQINWEHKMPINNFYSIRAWKSFFLDKRNQRILEKGEFKNKNNEITKFEVKEVDPIVVNRGKFFVINILNPNNINKYDGWAHFSFDCKGNYIEIEDVFIDPERRNIGLGTKLLSTIAEYAKSWKVDKIVGWVSVEDAINEIEEQRIKNFFSREGYNFTQDDTKFIGSLFRFEMSLLAT